jgi:putative transposase
LPDHLHCLWKLPSSDANYSTRWSKIKRLFTRNYLTEVGSNEKRNASRIKRQEGAIWRRRFWEHTSADKDDYEFHLHYIHFNPIKHGYVSRAADWP